MNSSGRIARDEFTIIFDDWMTFETISIDQTFVVKDITLLAEIKYPSNASKDTNEVFDFMCEKALQRYALL